jgi:hypothetical protein
MHDDKEEAMADELPGYIPVKLLPKDIAELLAFVPVRGWDAIEWRSLLGQLRLISWQLASRKGVKSLTASADTLSESVSLSQASGSPLKGLSEREKKLAGNAILRFYFAQFRNPEGLFLDFRETRFTWKNGALNFRPSGLYVKLDDDFRTGMLDLYRGFYEPDAELLDQALHRMGLLHQDLEPGDVQALKRLLEQHFGSQQRSQTFALSTFRQSFNALFDFFIDKRYSLRSDFVFVGFYLITLYMALESLGQHHDVRTLWKKAMSG